MPFNDAQMSDVTVVLDPKYADKLPEAIEEMKKCGLSVANSDDNSGVVEGTVLSEKVQDLQKLDCVDYVRTTFSWIADYPPGDPRDLDKVSREWDHD
jgi:hypothetical protein